MKTLLWSVAVFWLAGAVWWLCLYVAFRRAQNRRGGRLMRLLVMNAPERWK
jgi:hypothetical protein